MALFSEKVEKQIKVLLKRKKEIEKESEEIDEQIEKLKIGDSAIKVGDIIEWIKHNRKTQGVVISIAVHNGYDPEYCYRCTILSSKGLPIGNASVSEDENPTKVGTYKRIGK